MKTYKRTSVLSLTAAGALLLGALIPVLKMNAAPQDADSPSGTPTNRAVAGRVQAEATDATATTETANLEPVQTRGNQQPIVVFGKNVELKAGDSAEVVVVIFGSAKIRGKRTCA